MRNLTLPPAEDAQSPAPAVVAVLHDISPQKAIQTRNAQFVSAVSHEMLTPLAGIKAYVELLQDGEAQDDASQTQFLEVINQQANRLQRLVDEMLNLSRLEAGVTCVTKEPSSLNSILATAVHAVDRAAQEAGVKVETRFSPGDLAVLVDRQLALDGATHLLANAIRSVRPEGRVILRTLYEGSNAVFEVEDDGPRLSPADRVRVFEKFYRLRPETGADETGLDLPLVKHIVEQVHGGSIEVESTPETGNVFRVFLPLAEDAAMPVEAVPAADVPLAEVLEV
jgi:two-component system phosphate regulon sensor histidine kinase PhoR